MITERNIAFNRITRSTNRYQIIKRNREHWELIFGIKMIQLKCPCENFVDTIYFFPLKYLYIFKNNPYLEESTENIKFSYNILGVDYLIREDDIDITIDGKNEYIDAANNLHLTELYNRHKDIVQEIIKKVKYYNPSYISSVLELGGKLFSDREELYRILYGGYANPEDFEKRPLSKFIKDIYMDTVESTGGYDILLYP